MLYNYLALAFFSIFAILIPLSFLLTAKLLGRKSTGNPVKNSPFESGEESIGTSKDIGNEYLPMFMLFLPFELIVAILIIWSITYNSLSYDSNLAILALLVVSTIVALVGYVMSGVSDE